MNRAEIIKFPLREKITSKNNLIRLCDESLIEKIDQNNIQIYRERLSHELSVIDSMGFNDYF